MSSITSVLAAERIADLGNDSPGTNTRSVIQPHTEPPQATNVVLNNSIQPHTEPPQATSVVLNNSIQPHTEPPQATNVVPNNAQLPQQVFDLYDRGETVPQIAFNLNLSEAAVQNYLALTKTA